MFKNILISLIILLSSLESFSQNVLLTERDSLNHFRGSFFDCADILKNCVNEKVELNQLYIQSEVKFNGLQKQFVYYLEKTNDLEKVNLKLESNLKKEKRKVGIWKAVGLTGIATTILTTTLIFIKK